MPSYKTGDPKKAPTPDPKGRCGSSAGYQAHRRRGEEACEACRLAHSAADRARKQGKTGVNSPPAKPRRRHIPIEHKLEALETGTNDPRPVEMPPESVEETKEPDKVVEEAAKESAQEPTSDATEPAEAPTPAKAPNPAKDAKEPAKTAEAPAKAPNPAKDAKEPAKTAEAPAKAAEASDKAPAKQAPSKPARPAKATAVRKVPDGVPTPPDWLRARGLELWIEVTQAHKLNASALTLLGEACRTADRLERLAAALASRSTMWFELGDIDQATELGVPIIVNGMIGEARQLQTTLRQTLTTLKVVEVDAAEKVAKSPLDELAARRKKRLAEQGGA